MKHTRVGCGSQRRRVVGPPRLSGRVTIVTSKPACAAQLRTADRWVIVGRQGQVHQAEEVFQNLRIPMHAGLPILVDSSFQTRLCVGYRLWVRWHAVVVPRLRVYTIEVGRMSVLSTLGQESKVLQYEVLCSTARPFPGKILSALLKQSRDISSKTNFISE